MEPAVTPSRRKRLRHGMRGSCWGRHRSACYFWQRQAPCRRKRCLWGHTMCLDAHSHGSCLAAGHQGHQLPLPHLPLHPGTNPPSQLSPTPSPRYSVKLQRLIPSAGACAEASLVHHIHPFVLIPSPCPLPLARPAAWLGQVTILLFPARPLVEHHQGWLLVQTGLLGVPDTRGPPLRRA